MAELCSAELAEPLTANDQSMDFELQADAAGEESPADASKGNADGEAGAAARGKEKPEGTSQGATKGRKKQLKPLKFNAIKILNTLSYNPAMRRELIKADSVEALMTFAKDTLKEEVTSGVRYTRLATNE